jgi:hypothetical protein
LEVGPELEVEGFLQTPDGAWRVEIVRRGSTCWYRVVNEARDLELHWLSIVSVERILRELGVDPADLVEPTEEPGPAGDGTHGVA